MTEILRYTAFSDVAEGGNPAGVVLDASGLDDEAMQKIAADVGYSETSFVQPRGDGTLGVRYFSPLAEVPFCGHATIATAIAYAEQNGPADLVLHTGAGTVPVTVREHEGLPLATLTSVAPSVADLSGDDLAELLAALRWSVDDVSPDLPPRVAFAGVHHPVIAASTRERLADLSYDFDRLGALMVAHDWTTVQLVWRENDTTLHVRDPFPPGGVVEDPATGAAAAALGGYLRNLGLIDPPTQLTVHQGQDMGRPSTIFVQIPVGEQTGIAVSGHAVRLA